MPGKLRTNLRQHLTNLHPSHVTTRLQAATRSQIHRALQAARTELEPFGYHVAVTTDTGSMISAKIYGWSIDRDFKKEAQALIAEKGYPINLQLSVDDARGMTVYSYRGGGQGVQVITSKKQDEIEDAVFREVESQVIAGIDSIQQEQRG